MRCRGSNYNTDAANFLTSKLLGSSSPWSDAAVSASRLVGLHSFLYSRLGYVRTTERFRNWVRLLSTSSCRSELNESPSSNIWLSDNEVKTSSNIVDWMYHSYLRGSCGGKSPVKGSPASFCPGSSSSTNATRCVSSCLVIYSANLYGKMLHGVVMI